MTDERIRELAAECEARIDEHLLPTGSSEDLRDLLAWVIRRAVDEQDSETRLAMMKAIADDMVISAQSEVRLLKLAVAEEREACAKLAEGMDDYSDKFDFALRIAEAIRARDHGPNPVPDPEKGKAG